MCYFATVMKYLVRAAKYYLYILIVLIILLFVLVRMNLASADIGEMFRNGYDSLWQIAALLAVFSAIYPRIGYGSRQVNLPGSYGELRDGIISYMDEKGYRLSSEQDENMVFVLRSPMGRLFRMFEDNITLTREMTGFAVEGRVKDVVRIVSGLQARLRVNP